jgi:hypothetical protein
MEPAGAGVIYGSTTSADVTWTTGFTGTASISVRTINDCGPSDFSPVYNVSVYSSQGVDDPKALSGIKLFPNPNDGNFILEMVSGKEQQVRLQMATSGGARIMDNLETVTAGPYQKTFNMSTLPAGTYYLLILDKDGRLLNRQQVVVK